MSGTEREKRRSSRLGRELNRKGGRGEGGQKKSLRGDDERRGRKIEEREKEIEIERERICATPVLPIGFGVRGMTSYKHANTFKKYTKASKTEVRKSFKSHISLHVRVILRLSYNTGGEGDRGGRCIPPTPTLHIIIVLGVTTPQHTKPQYY